MRSDLLRFPADSAERFVADDGTVRVRLEEIERIRIGRADPDERVIP